MPPGGMAGALFSSGMSVMSTSVVRIMAAMEAAFYHVPAVALSYAREDPPDFASAARYAVDAFDKVKNLNLAAVININIPKLSAGKPKGIKIVPQSTLGFDEHYIKQANADGGLLYQLAGGDHKDIDIPCDTLALIDGFITITTLGFDMTDYKLMVIFEIFFYLSVCMQRYHWFIRFL